MNEKNYERELGAIDAKINFLEKKFERYEIDTAIKLKEIKEQNEKIEQKINSRNKDLEIKILQDFNVIKDSIEELKAQSIFTKGFIKAVIISGSLLGFIITLSVTVFK